MAEAHPPEISHGVVIGPLYTDTSPDELAKNIFQLLKRVGIKCSDVCRLSINPKGGYAKIALTTHEGENYVLKVLKEVKSIMSLYDLRLIMEHPEQLVVERMRNVNKKKSVSDDTPTNYATVGDFPLSELPDVEVEPAQESPETGERNLSVAATFFKGSDMALSNPAPEVEGMAGEGESGLGVHAATSTSDSLPLHRIVSQSSDDSSDGNHSEKPIMVHAKTSTPFFYPCDCPETVFYYHLQHVGTETRHAEFKKGGVIHDQKALKATIAKYMCGFHNSEGGTLYLGVSDDGIVLGITVDQALEDTLRNDVDFAVRLIEPSVDPCEYSINFARVMTVNDELSPNMKVLEICVKPRRPPINFYSYNDVVYLRRDGSLQAMGRINLPRGPGA